MFVVIDAEGRLVDEDIALAEIGRQPAGLLHGDRQLGNLVAIGMAADGTDRGTTNDTVGLQAGSFWKAFTSSTTSGVYVGVFW